jgi:hypothetical protein
MVTKRNQVKLAFGATAAILATACGGEDASPPSDATFDEPLYAMMIQVYDPEDRTVYVSLSNTLDIESTELESAREFASVANFAEIGGRVLVSSGSGATITEFDVSDQFDWFEGRTVGFTGYPLLDNANFYYQFVVDESHALLPYEGTSRILWNPSEMVIEGTLEDTSLPEAEPGLTREAGGNRNAVHYDASVMQAVFYHDDDWYDYGTRSHVIVYDEETFAEERIHDVPCPALSLATRDEQGNTYFAAWDLPTTSLLDEAPATCVAKVDADNELVDTIDLRDWTDGRAVGNFRYVGNGKAFANVLHHEVFGVQSTAELDAETLDNLWMGGPHWKLWLFDVEAGTGAPVEGIDVEMTTGAQFALIDGRTFVFVPYDDWARTKAYELAANGTATEHFDTVGDVYQWVRVR